MKVSDKFQEWYKSQNQIEKTDSIKKCAIRLNSLKKRFEKAIEASHGYGFNRSGKRGGKFTSLNAKVQILASQYIACEDELKYMVKGL